MHACILYIGTAEMLANNYGISCNIICIYYSIAWKHGLPFCLSVWHTYTYVCTMHTHSTVILYKDYNTSLLLLCTYVLLVSLGRQDSSVIARQQALNERYGKLLQRAAERRKRLEDSIRQFRMFRDCDELESWIKEKEVVMKAEEKSTGKERVEAMHKKFEVGTDKCWNMMCAQLVIYVCMYICTYVHM